MQTMQEKSFNDLVEQFLGIRLPQQMADAVCWSELPPYVQDFIMRMLKLMKRSGYTATGFNPHLIRWLSASIPSMLPDAWGGRIPPITLPIYSAGGRPASLIAALRKSGTAFRSTSVPFYVGSPQFVSSILNSCS